jgi:hypothetical protein
MKTAKFVIAEPYKVTVVPTEMRFSLVRDMFEAEEQKLCEIGYEILAGKYAKLEPKLDEAGAPVLKSGKPVMEEILVDFSSPVLFDTGTKVIPFGLYLLIESYRMTGSEEQLAQINGALSQFGLVGSLSEFVISVESVA